MCTQSPELLAPPDMPTSMKQTASCVSDDTQGSSIRPAIKEAIKKLNKLIPCIQIDIKKLEYFSI